MKSFAQTKLEDISANMDRVKFYTHPTNDAWCRDHGPAFLVNPAAAQPKIIIDWNYNAWGNKYPPYDLDDRIPTLIASAYRDSGALSGNHHGGGFSGFQRKRNTDHVQSPAC